MTLNTDGDQRNLPVKKEKCVSLDMCCLSGENQKSTFWETKTERPRCPDEEAGWQQQGSTHQNSVLCLVCFDLQFDSLPQWQLHLPPHRVPHALWAQKMGENRHIQLWKWKKYSCRADYGALLNILYWQVMEEHRYGLEKKRKNLIKWQLPQHDWVQSEKQAPLPPCIPAFMFHAIARIYL